MGRELRQTAKYQIFFTEVLPMFYAGIDISKYKHDCFILSDFGEVVNDGFAFSNTANGFAQLQQVLDELGHDNVRIGFESTGHYTINLKLFLEKNGFEFMEINPYLIKKWLEGDSLRQTYTDKICAKAIAGYLCEKEFRPHMTDFYDTFALKQRSLFHAQIRGT
jgi:transposase